MPKTILFLMALCIGILGFKVYQPLPITNFGDIQTTQTASSDTLNTLRTNTNQALADIKTVVNAFSTTTNNVFTGTNSFAANTATFATIAGTIINTGTFKQSSSGTTLTGSNFGVCSAWSMGSTVAATTTLTFDCGGGALGQTALTGITAGDNITLQMGTTTSVIFEGLHILGASASSTQGYITVKLYNGTGNTFTWTAAASSSFMYTARR